MVDEPGRAILADPRRGVVWQGGIDDYPVIVAGASVIALGRPDGSVEGVDGISTAVAGRTGEYLFVGPFFRLSDRAVSGSTALQFADGDVIATTGAGVPVGDLKPPSAPGILYVRP